ncbi:MAG TPA: NUDIX hydrolase [Streptosporangiaceae bacterium]|nr:NUDIX hydrolase [Streptosporangiaceae bacterium]
MAEDAVNAASIQIQREVGEGARAILSGDRDPVPPRDAATVMLVRSSAAGLEVYMLRRKASMAFAPGAYVFPGGSVDARDADEEVAWTGPDAAEWGRAFDAPPALARALVCAAVRETFEEAGVLLAGESADSVVADTTSDEWEADRQALLHRSVSLAELLRRRGLVLRADLLRPWSRWITPVVEPRRFDTRFFAAELPAGQRTRDVGGEASEVAWVAPEKAFKAGERGEIRLFPPTAVTLSELAACGDLETVLTGPRQVAPDHPRSSGPGRSRVADRPRP